jgi:predicted phosphodiesterase
MFSNHFRFKRTTHKTLKEEVQEKEKFQDEHYTPDVVVIGGDYIHPTTLREEYYTPDEVVVIGGDYIHPPTLKMSITPPMK